MNLYDIKKPDNLIIRWYLDKRGEMFQEYGYRKTLLRLKKQKSSIINENEIYWLRKRLERDEIKDLNIGIVEIKSIIGRYKKQKREDYFDKLKSLSEKGQKIFNEILNLVQKYDLWFDFEADLILERPKTPKIYSGYLKEFTLKFAGTDIRHFDIEGCPYMKGLEISYEVELSNEFDKIMDEINCFWESYDKTTYVFFSKLDSE